MKAITIDAPWAWAIMQGHKQVENRTWRTHHRGPLAIHASLATRSDEAAAELFARVGIVGPNAQELDALRGCVLGTVDVLDCVRHPLAGGDGRLALDGYDLASDPFATGPECFLLADPRPLARPVPVTGKQTLWTLPESVKL